MLNDAHRQSGRSNAGGFALLLTLLLLVIAATVMVGMARRSMDAAVRAAEAQRELQRRWAMRSCRATLASRVEQVLADREAQSNQPVSTVRIMLSLADQPIELLFTDEQAKANVNVLFARSDMAGVEQSVRRLLFESRSEARVRLRPSAQRLGALSVQNHGHRAPSIATAFTAFDQVFAGASADQLTGGDTGEGAAANVTCWGDGRLNFRRASRAALEQVCRLWLSTAQIDRLIDLRRRLPGLGVGAALDQLELTDQRRRQVARLLTDTSSCHGLWIIARSDDRAWHELTVIDGAGGSPGGVTGGGTKGTTGAATGVAAGGGGANGGGA